MAKQDGKEKRAYMREYCKQHATRIAKQKKEYIAANRKSIAAQTKDYRKINRDVIIQRRRTLYARTGGTIVARRREYVTNHPRAAKAAQRKMNRGWERAPQRRTNWIDSEDAELLRLAAEGVAKRDIGVVLGRSYAAVVHRLIRLLRK